MFTRTRFLVDDSITPVSFIDHEYQKLDVVWHDITELPPAGEMLYLCYNHIIQPDVLHVKTMETTIWENCRVSYEHVSPNITKPIFERLSYSEYDYWVAMPEPDYWAIKEFPKPPIRV